MYMVRVTSFQCTCQFITEIPIISSINGQPKIISHKIFNTEITQFTSIFPSYWCISILRLEVFMLNHIHCINPLSIQVVLILAVSETSLRVYHTLSRQPYSYLTFGHIQKGAAYNSVQIIQTRRSYDHICLVSTVLRTYGSTIQNHSMHFSNCCIAVMNSI
jgi:hypothetical protein